MPTWQRLPLSSIVIFVVDALSLDSFMHGLVAPKKQIENNRHDEVVYLCFRNSNKGEDLVSFRDHFAVL